MIKILLTGATCISLCACSQKQQADLLIHNATIYTVDSTFSVAEAMIIAGGKVLETGSLDQLEKKYAAKNRLDAQGKFIYPGFIDAHAHFLGYGRSLQRVNLVGTRSWKEVVEKTKQFASTHNIKPGQWILGRGWDQNDWERKEFPSKDELDTLFRDNPVLLTRVDGHAAIANQLALDLGGIKAGAKLIGGEIEIKDGKLTGILVDNAIDRVSARIPAATAEQFAKELRDAEANCFAMGLTTIDDCGLSYQSVDRIMALHKNGSLKMRLFIMLSDEPANYDYLEHSGVIKTDRLHVRGFKVYGDGALGSRGACLLKPYSDRPGYSGFLLSSPAHFDSVASRIHKRGFQMCTHAIGDSGTRIILNTYQKYLAGKNDLRWRIEHAQVVNPADFALFGANSIIPSVQPTHATSDMYWAAERLGNERVKGAYAFKQLLQQNGWIALGTDFPVEDISPFKTFFAAVARKDDKGWPAGGFQPENALTREEALKGMTIWAAQSNFEEKDKGSLEKGKWADFIILNRDLMTVNEMEILQTSVLKTFLAGELVYQKN